MKNILLAIDQLANTLIGGHADETISARAWRMQHKRGWRLTRKVIDKLFWWEPNHCYQSYVSERGRLHLPKEYQE